LSSINEKYGKISRIDDFCPTYELLKSHKNGGKWEDYVERYQKIIKGRKESILAWFEALEPDHIYLLCCWENTSKGVHCHRELLYNWFKNSKKLKDVAYYVYRDGGIESNYDNSYFCKEVAHGLKESKSVKVTIENQHMADVTGFGLETEIGGWQLNVDPIYQHIVEGLLLLNDLPPSMGSITVESSPQTDENNP
jgi:hypothetical protein